MSDVQIYKLALSHAFSYAGFFSSSTWGGGDTPNADYPQFAELENVQRVAGGGASGQNVIDAVNHSDYTIAWVTQCGVGNQANGQFDCRGGGVGKPIKIRWKQQFRASALNEVGYSVPLVIGHGGNGGTGNGIFSFQVCFLLEMFQTAGAGFDWVANYLKPGASSFLTEAVNGSSDTADDAEHEIIVTLTPSTVTGAFPGANSSVGAVIASDGAFDVSVDGASVASASGIKLAINGFSTTTPGVYYAKSLWHGDADLPGYISDTEVYYSDSEATVDGDDSTPCCGDGVDSGGGGTTPGVTPQQDPFVSLPAWEVSCAGGGAPPIEADVSDAESWTVTRVSPAIEVTLTIPTDSTDVTRRYGTRPFANATKTHAGILEMSGPVRGLSDDQGSPKVSSADVLINDDGGVLRALIADDPTRFVSGAQATLTVLSEAGRTAATARRSLLRARMDAPEFDIQQVDGGQRRRTVRLRCIDALAPHYDAQLNATLFERKFFPDIHRDLENTPIPLIGGEHSDQGAQDVIGNSAEKGMVPVFYVGGRKTISNTDPISSAPSFLAPPSNVAAAVNGTPGSATRYYAVTARNAVGETVLSTVVTVSTSPAALTSTDSITVTWDTVTGATAYVVYRGFYPTPSRRVKVLAAGVTTFTDTGVDPEVPPGPPAYNTAQVAADPNDFYWDFYVVCLGYVPIAKIFASNDARGTAPQRITDPAFVTGGQDFCTPDCSIWPHPDPWVDITAADGSTIRVTGFYGRGPRSQHHKDGTVTIAIQTCGPEDVGDASGDSIQQAFPLWQHFLNNFVPMDGAPVYTTGTWKALRRYADGVAIIQTSKVTGCQDLTADFLGTAEGYRGAIYLRDPITVREFLQRFCTTFDAFVATNHHGQIYPFIVNPYADVSDGRHYRERIEIVTLEQPELDKSNVEPLIRFQYDWDPDAAKFRSEIEKRQDDEAADAQPGLTRDVPVRQLIYTRDADTARDAMNRRVQRLKYQRWRQPFVTRFRPSLEDEPGAQIRISHTDGPLGISGWENRAFYIEEHVVLDPTKGTVRLTCIDQHPLLELVQMLPDGLLDEGADADVLGDETSDDPPPTGAGVLL